MGKEYQDRVWICSDYGIENSYVVKRLRSSKEPVYVVSHDDETDWNRVLAENPDLIKEIREKNKAVYGIGINGELNVDGVNIQNLYSEARPNLVDDNSVLKQVCNILGARMTLTEQFASAYSLHGEEGVKDISRKLLRTDEEARQAAQFWEFQDMMSRGYGIEESLDVIVEKRSKMMSAHNSEKESDIELEKSESERN